MSDIHKPPFQPTPDLNPPRNEPGAKHRRWIVHSHEAFRPEHVEATSDINITPLIDVMLVLLIIFMVVTPLAQRGLDIALPAPDTQKQNEPQRQPGNEVVLSVEEAPGGGSVVSINKNPVANMEDLEAATIEDVAGFFRTFYVPNNAVLTVCGDFESARALDLVDRYFGEIPPRAPLPPLPGRSEIEPRIGRTVREHVVAQVPLPRVLHPSVRTFEHERDGRYCFEVEAHLPLSGLLIRYGGWLQRAGP